jgi:hypothetical protein
MWGKTYEHVVGDSKAIRSLEPLQGVDSINVASDIGGVGHFTAADGNDLR